MVAIAGGLKRPAGGRHVGPDTVIEVLRATGDLLGEAAVGTVLAEAGLDRAPTPGSPIREDSAAAVHAAIRRTRPGEAVDILTGAGTRSAQNVLEAGISSRARSLLASAPWTVAAWLLGRSMTQTSWSVFGSGKYELISGLEFAVTDNPFTRGETAEAPLCHYHTAFFQQIYDGLVDSRLICREVECAATGAPRCRFVFYVDE